MTDVRLYVTTIGLVASTAAYVAVGWLLANRPPEHSQRTAHLMFRIWWFGLALATGTYAARNVLALSGVMFMPLHLLLLQLLVVGDAVALVGLVTYLLALYTGRPRVYKPVVGFYVLYFLFYTFLIFYTRPNGLEVGPVRTALTYAGPNATAVVMWGVALFYVPQFAAALVHSALLRSPLDSTRRWRVVWVASSTLVWSAANMALIVTSMLNRHGWEFTAQMLILVAPLGGVLAFAPPTWVQSRWGVDSVVGERARALRAAM